MTNVKHPSSSRKASFLFCRKILNWEYCLCFGFQITFKRNLLYMYLLLTNVFWSVDFLWSINSKPLTYISICSLNHIYFDMIIYLHLTIHNSFSIPWVCTGTKFYSHECLGLSKWKETLISTTVNIFFSWRKSEISQWFGGFNFVQNCLRRTASGWT